MRRSLSLLALSALALFVAACVEAGNGGSAVSPAKIGEPAPGFSLQSFDGKTVKLDDFKGKVVVLEWINPACPFVQRHYKEKTMNTLAEQYRDQGVAWLAINSTHDAGSDVNQKWATQFQMSRPILDDSAGAVGRAYGAKTTPHMFIIDRNGKLVYAGGIDNDPDGEHPRERVNYVRKALDELLAGKPVSQPQTKSYGCSVKYAE